jgi:hypothetical protein
MPQAESPVPLFPPAAYCAQRLVSLDRELQGEYAVRPDTAGQAQAAIDRQIEWLGLQIEAEETRAAGIGAEDAFGAVLQLALLAASIDEMRAMREGDAWAKELIVADQRIRSLLKYINPQGQVLPDLVAIYVGGRS